MTRARPLPVHNRYTSDPTRTFTSANNAQQQEAEFTGDEGSSPEGAGRETTTSNVRDMEAGIQIPLPDQEKGVDQEFRDPSVAR